MTLGSRFGDWLISFIVRYKKLCFFLALATTILVTSFIPKIRFENSVESFISPKDKDLAYYQEFKKEFDDDQMIALVFPEGDVFTKQNLSEIDQLSQEIKKLPLVKKVKSITEAQDIVGTEDGFEVKHFLEKIPDDLSALAKLKASAIANPLYKIDLISLDGSIASMLIQPRYSKDPDRYKKIVDGLHEIIDKSPLKNREYHISGDPVLELQMTQDMWKDLRTFIPVTYFCLVIIIYLLFRDFQSVVVLILMISLCIGWAMGLMGFFKITMNAVTSGLPSLMLCIASLDGIHMLGFYRYHLQQKEEPGTALYTSLRHSLKPCFITSVTTMIGFASMAVTDLIPIRQFGILGALSTAAAYPVCIMTMPLLISLIPSSHQHTLEEGNSLMPFFRWIERHFYHKRVFIPLLVFTIAFCVVGISKINVETNHIKFLKKNSPVKISTDYIQEKLGGVSPLEITIETPQDGMVKDPHVLKEIEKLQDFMESLPGVDKTTSPVQFIKEMHQAMNSENPAYYFIPDSRDLIAQYILTYSFSGRNNDLDDFVDYTYKTARIRGRMKNEGAVKLRETLRAIQEFADKDFDPNIKLRITSHTLLVTNMINTLINGQIGGLATELFFMTLIFSLVHRSLIIGFFSMIPNAIPIAAVAALMGYAHISLNPGTAMTVGIAFGLVVDDTIHFLHHARECLMNEKDVSKVTEKIFEMVGPPVLFTAALLALGFGVLAFGRSLMTIQFGVLCAFAIIWALVCEILITPYLITRVPIFRRALMRE